MHNVMADSGPLGRPQGIDTSHVAEHSVTEMVQMIVLDPVALGPAGFVAPPPANRNGRVEPVSNVAVADHIIGAMADPHAHRMRGNPPAALDDAVVDSYAAGSFWFGHERFLPNTNAADTQVKHPAMLHSTIATGLTE